MELPRDDKSLDDPINRKNASVPDKLAWVCDQAKAAFGRDARGGGFSLVAQPAVIEHVVGLLKPHERQMQRIVVVGTTGAEIVAWWVPPGGKPIPMRCSYRARDARIWCVPDDLLVPFDQVDRRAAAEIRVAIARGEIRVVS